MSAGSRARRRILPARLRRLRDYVQDHSPNKVVLLTECSMSDNVASENPDVNFIRPCNLCPHMKRITLENIYDCLVTGAV